MEIFRYRTKMLKMCLPKQAFGIFTVLLSLVLIEPSLQDDSICRLPLESGNCFAAFPRWGYDPKQKRCVKFTYGGCGGNMNNFLSLVECNTECAGPVCNLPLVTGPCKAAFPRYGYSSKEKKCVKFIYGGCGGNANNFENPADCELMCPERKLCSLPLVQGPCEAAIPVWGYDSKARKCRKFIYGGCQGNCNRFRSKEACRRSCECESSSS